MRRLFPGWTAFGISFSVLLLQLVQTRIFSVIFWNHLVYFIISIALLGFGISGTWLALGPRSRLVRSLTLKRSAIGFVLSVFISTLAAPMFRFKSALVPGDWMELLRLLITYAAATFPYFFAGWILGILFRDHADRIHKLYWWDLVGAAAGCLIYVLIIRHVGAVGLIVLACVPAMTLIFLNDDRRPRDVALGAAACVLLLFSFLFRARIEEGIRPERTKAFNSHFVPPSNEGSRVIEISEWNSISRIDVLFHKEEPHWRRVYIDGDAWTGIRQSRMEESLPWDPEALRFSSNSIPYVLHPHARSVLVIGSGGGEDVWYALRAKPTRVDAVEINPTTYRLMREEYREKNDGLFWQPPVHTYMEEGRSFVRRTNERYDVLVLHAIDTFAALNSGAYVLSENYLYTVDAVRDYFRHLTPNGVLCISRWFHPGETVRLFTTVLEALIEEGIPNPEKHVAVAGWHMASVLVKATPFTDSEISVLRGATDRSKGNFLYPIDRVANRFEYVLQQYPLLRKEGKQEDIFGVYPYDVTPVSDDSPFFFNYERWDHLLSAFQRHGDWSLIRGNWPTLTLWALLLLSFAAVFFFILVPLLRKEAEIKGRREFRFWIIYFICLGIGFIFVEIALMQRFALLLGHPARSLAIVLGGLLLSSGVGSLAAPRWCPTRHMERMLFLGGLILLAALLYPRLINLVLGQALWVRGAIALALVFPLGFLMGMPFPTGIRAVSEREGAAVPWMWGINGGTTVMGSILAIILAIVLNFTAVLLLAAVAYLVGALAYSRARITHTE